MKAKKEKLIQIYLKGPLVLAGLLVALTVASYFINLHVGRWMTAVSLGYILAAVIVYFVSRKRIAKKLSEFGLNYFRLQENLFGGIDVPLALVGEDGELFWGNEKFEKSFYGKRAHKLLMNIFPEIENVDYRKGTPCEVHFEEKTYEMHSFAVEDEAVKELNELSGNSINNLTMVYLLDRTELLYYRTTLENEKCVMAVVFFDNYEEVMGGIESVRRSLLSALLERKLSKYVSSVQGVMRKLEKDRYFIVLKQEALRKLREDRFSILEDIKTVNIGNDIPATLSIGIGLGGVSFEKNYDYARSAVDMALGRGGDQVVIKEENKVEYFGGKAKTVEKSTRVKARIKAQALRELVNARDTVLIMGHPLSDLDCIGAAMGIYRVARFSGKNVHIVMDEVSNSVKPLLSTFKTSEYGERLFVSPETALEIADRDSLLVVVDTNRPSYTVCPELLKKVPSVVVMDHHRQGREIIENAVLSYVEPYASSTSEMVAEVIQYYADELKLRPAEADAVLAGIVMDTNNFEDKAGVRTFEAAAYLRRCGADVTHVRKIFRDSMEDYKLRAETVRRAEVYKDDYIISICPNEGANSNQTVVAAQAANELLEIRGIKASFVLTEYEGKIYMSARSIDEVNVQVIAEKLGGGGHLSVAGAQFTDTTIEEVLERLKKVIEEA